MSLCQRVVFLLSKSSMGSTTFLVSPRSMTEAWSKMEGSSSRSRNNDRCYGAVLDFIASRGYPASEGIQHASTFALRYPRLRWWRAALSAQHLLSAMPTHAEVIAQNPLEAPADFWTNAARKRTSGSGVESGLLFEALLSLL